MTGDASNESKSSLVPFSHTPLPGQRSHVHLRGWKSQTWHLQGSEPRQSDISRSARALERTLLSACLSSLPHRRIGNSERATGPPAVSMFLMLRGSQWEFQPSGSGYKIKKVGATSYTHPTKPVMTNNFERFIATRSTKENQTNSVTR